MQKNLDQKTVEGFGDEWSRFDQTGMSDEDTQRVFESYFAVFPWAKLPKDAVGFDLGCGSGRWAKLVAQRLAEGGGDCTASIQVLRLKWHAGTCRA
jgi:hypothetical protein